MIRRQRLPPSGPARQARCSTPAALVRVRAPLFREPAQKAGFCFWRTGLYIELRSMIRRQRLTPSGPARQARCSTPAALVRVRAPLFRKTSLRAGFLLLENRTLHRTPFDDSPPSAHPFGASATGALFNASHVNPGSPTVNFFSRLSALRNCFCFPERSGKCEITPWHRAPRNTFR
ncbi:Uncharacterised protein [Atlantibacter hermannii]|nr:Uncharacterised protein [Atlantibacter hermannii]